MICWSEGHFELLSVWEYVCFLVCNYQQSVAQEFCQVCRLVVMSQVQTDLALSGELMDDLCLKFRVVDPGLSEGSGVAILLPVVMPVPMLVSTITKHWHLEPKCWSSKNEEANLYNQVGL